MNRGKQHQWRFAGRKTDRNLPLVTKTTKALS